MPVISPIKVVYRSLLRESGKLPHLYLRSFFGLYFRDYFRENILGNRCNPQLVTAKIVKAQRELRRLQKANRGEKKAFEHVLDLAYGRKGKMKHELMKTYLENPFQAPPPRIISAVERSRPPSYSPELATLLTSLHSRTLTRPLKPAALNKPPTLPDRADPSSEEARNLGSLSKRREVNIRWRYHTGEISRTYYPLELTEPDCPEPKKHNLRGTGLEKLGLLREVEKLACSPLNGRPLPRRQRGTRAHVETRVSQPYQVKFDSPLRSRFLRRRYRELLGRIPILIPDDTAQYSAKTMWSPLALVSNERNVQYAGASQEDVDWLIAAEKTGNGSQR